MLGCTLVTIAAINASDWPQWRGPNIDGVSSEAGFPKEWDGESGKNILWKTRLPGVGNGSPIVVGNDLILTASSGADHAELHLICYNRETGKARWQTDLTATPADTPFRMFPPERGNAASTAWADEQRIVALFGSGDLVCLDREGKPLWFRSLAKDYGVIRNDYGIASSPIVVGQSVLVQIDHLEGSYILAIDLATGKTRWKTDRDGIYDNWATPVTAEVGGEAQVICLGTRLVVGYSLASGEQKWKLEGLERLCSSTPIVHDGMLYAVSGPSGATLAIDLNFSTPQLKWSSRKNGPFVPSAIVANGLYCMADDQGMATCLELSSGKEQWRERLANGRMRPSPVAADGLIYFTALDGVTYVVEAKAEFEVVAENPLGEAVAGSFAMSRGQLFIRGEHHLWCVAKR